MKTECKRNRMKFQDFWKRKVVGHFDGGTISSATIKIIVTCPCIYFAILPSIAGGLALELFLHSEIL